MDERNKFGLPVATTVEKLDAAMESDIVRGSENILDATTLAEVFA